MTRRYLRLSFAVVSLTLVYSCNSSSTSTSDTNGDVNAASVSNVSSTFNALEGLLFDGSEGSSRLSTRGTITGPPVGSFSYMGCNYIQDRGRLLQNVDQVRGTLCHIGTAEAADVGFKVGENDFNYFKVTGVKDGPEGTPGEFLLRVGVFDSEGGKKCLKMHMCENDALKETVEVCETDDGVSAETSHKSTENFGGEDHTFKNQLALTANATDGEISSVDLSAYFSDDFGAGSAILTGDKETQSNTFVGRFGFTHTTSDDKSFSGDNGVCVYAGGGTGSGVVKGTNTFPAFLNDSDGYYYCPPIPGSETWEPVLDENQDGVCEQVFPEHTESFDIVAGDPPVSNIIADEDSPWFASLADCSIPDEPTPPSVPTGWDCSAPDGFTEVDASSIDFTECEKFSERKFEGDNNCDFQRVEAEQQPPP